MYQACAALWHTLSDAEKQQWKSDAARQHMTGFALWQSSCLRPNPGIYLPLAGGTMSGDISMSGQRILVLPLPVDSQEPLTLAYYTTNILPYLPTPRARVFHTVAQEIPNNTITWLTFDSERFDNDTIHNPALNPSRLTCRTAGVYHIKLNVSWEFQNAGDRRCAIWLNGTIAISEDRDSRGLEEIYLHSASCIYQLGVGDYVEARVKQDCGAPLDILSTGQVSPEFSMARIGL